MDIHKLALEIGLFETALNLKESSIEENNEMPFPNSDMHTTIKNSAEWLGKLNKKKYMFLTPEIALIEKMTAEAEAIIIVPCGIDLESEERLKNNLPKNISVEILREPYFPENFTPNDGIIVACGYISSGRAMIMNETYRLIAHYGGFYGRKVFLPYVNIENFICFEGWKQSPQIFDDVRRD